MSTQRREGPFNGDILNSGDAFWRAYIETRASPSEAFFKLINNYHKQNGNPCSAVAHDVGTGPGNIARRLLPYFDHVVGSDVNEKALDAARALIPADDLRHMTFVACPAEALARAPLLPEHAGPGKTDLVVVSECMPLLDAPRAMEAFHALLRPGGTLAIYFYGRPVFVGERAATYNAMYGAIAAAAHRCLHPLQGSPSFAAYHRSATTLCSWLDNVEVPPASWERVERRKWNNDHNLAFSGPEGYDFEFGAVDRTHAAETKVEAIDREFWGAEMGVDRLVAYLGSALLGYRDRPETADQVVKVDELIQELKVAMGDEDSKKARVTFTVSLILATKTA
ncbi:putative DUF4243 and methyltransferase domain protein [Rosellinia necatrix]|uniref:Putative DUF4243 and methyltransferase domain protein n=1 Tax=Rosellinia necatrix TaxID=77044 RepID=A0A1W2TFQ3_ROSNE|nr:putative DUF4243 and methyltransferase domain protein [Rosellinia necatrix]